MKKFTFGTKKFMGINDEIMQVLKDEKRDWVDRFHKGYCYGEQGEYFDEKGNLKRGIIWYLKKGVEAWYLEEFFDFVISHEKRKKELIKNWKEKFHDQFGVNCYSRKCKAHRDSTSHWKCAEEFIEELLQDTNN